MMQFCDLLEMYFHETRKGSDVVRRIRIAERNVTFYFSSEESAAGMTAALSHLEDSGLADTAADFKVFMWGAERSPRNRVLRAYLYTLANWWFSYTGKRGELIDVHSGDLLTAYLPDLKVLCVVDVPNHRAFYWHSDAAPLPYYETASPFRSILHGWMRTQGRFFLHGAAVGYPEGGVLLVGKGGSGKSTSALSCLKSPLSYVGDDYCIVSGSAEDGFTAHSLYCTAKLVEQKNLESFPELCERVLNPVRGSEDKVALSLSHYRSSKLIQKFPLRAILVPKIIGGDTTSIVSCSPGEALMALAPSTVSQLPFSGSEELRFTAEMIRVLPTYRLMLGTLLDHTPIVIEELLTSLGVHPCTEGIEHELVTG